MISNNQMDEAVYEVVSKYYTDIDVVQHPNSCTIEIFYSKGTTEQHAHDHVYRKLERMREGIMSATGAEWATLKIVDIRTDRVVLVYEHYPSSTYIWERAA